MVFIIKKIENYFSTLEKETQLFWNNRIAPKLVQPSVCINTLTCNALFSLALYLFISSSVLNDPKSNSTASFTYPAYFFSGLFYLVYCLSQLGLLLFLGSSIFLMQNLRNLAKCVFVSNVMLSVINSLMLLLLSLHIILNDYLMTTITCPPSSYCAPQVYLHQLQAALTFFWFFMCIGCHLGVGMVQTYWPEKWKQKRKKSMSSNSPASVSFARECSGN